MSATSPDTNGMSRREELLAVATKLFAASRYGSWLQQTIPYFREQVEASRSA